MKRRATENKNHPVKGTDYNSVTTLAKPLRSNLFFKTATFKFFHFVPVESYPESRISKMVLYITQLSGDQRRKEGWLFNNPFLALISSSQGPRIMYRKNNEDCYAMTNDSRREIIFENQTGPQPPIFCSESFFLSKILFCIIPSLSPWTLFGGEELRQLGNKIFGVFFMEVERVVGG